MLKMFHRAKSKKGFTIVELIVVIAIIGILIALMLPSLNYNPKPTNGKAMAKAFYYQMQDVVMSMKLAQPNTFKSVVNGAAFGGTMYVYAAVGKDGRIMKRSNAEMSPIMGVINIASSPSGSVFDSSVYKSHAESAGITMYDKLEESIEKYTTDYPDMQGILTAVFDGNGVVRAAYWTEVDNSIDLLDNGGIVSGAPFATDFAQGTVFQDDNILASGHYCCAYPERLSRANAQMFVI